MPSPRSESCWRWRPAFYGLGHFSGKTLLAAGKPDAALAMIEADGNELTRRNFRPAALHAAGRQDEADAVLEAETKYADSAYYIAMTFAYRGDRDLAFEWLERAYQRREPGVTEIVGEHLFKNLADDPRYKALLRKMNLPD